MLQVMPFRQKKAEQKKYFENIWNILTTGIGFMVFKNLFDRFLELPYNC